MAAELGTDTRAVHRLVDDVHRATVLNYESIVADGDADDLLPSGERAPDHVLVDRERRAYLADAVLALPERPRAVVIGYFYQERPMLEIAAELGMTESRVSQLRAEALILLRDGLNAHLDPDTLPVEPRPDRRLARRRAAYHAAIAACSDFRARLDAAPLAPARAGRRGRLGRPHASLNPRSGNGFAWPGRCWITFLRSPPSLPVLLPSRRYAPFAPGLARLWRVMR